jgi:ribonuclease BN (tRNA processing enzyme)
MATVTILGSGTCVPSLVRSSCSLLLQSGEENVLLDLGPGTMHRLLAVGLGIDDIDVIMLSHIHPDHAGELPAFLFSTKYPAPMRRRKALQLIGGEGLKTFHTKLLDAFNGTISLPDGVLNIVELSSEGSDSLYLESCRLSWTTVVHRRESRAFRFTTSDGKTIVYSGDTDYSPALIKLADNADLFICESAFPDDKKTSGHLTPSLAGEIARKAAVKHLVLTHFYPVADASDIRVQCRRTYDGQLTIAEDLLRLEI